MLRGWLKGTTGHRDELEENEVDLYLEGVDRPDLQRQVRVVGDEYRLAHIDKHGNPDRFQANLVLTTVPPTVPPIQYQYPPPPRKTRNGAEP